MTNLTDVVDAKREEPKPAKRGRGRPANDEKAAEKKRVQFPIWIDPATRKFWKLVAAGEEKSVQELVEEAMAEKCRDLGYEPQTGKVRAGRKRENRD